MRFTNTKIHTDSDVTEKQFQVFEEILTSADHYSVLGIHQEASIEEITQAYKERLRFCHPTRSLPLSPCASKSFQILSSAYETLKDPVKRWKYDESKSNEKALIISPLTTNQEPNKAIEIEEYDDAKSNEKLPECFHCHHCYCDVVQQLFRDLCEGRFQTLRTFIYEINEIIPSTMQLSENMIDQIEAGFKRIHNMLKASQQCYNTTKQFYTVLLVEFDKLYSLKHELNSLSYFNLWRRTQLTVSIGKTLLQLPFTIYSATKDAENLQLKQKKPLCLEL